MGHAASRQRAVHVGLCPGRLSPLRTDCVHQARGGTWLYNKNLALLNAKDRFGDGSRYSILYGIIPPRLSTTGKGAMLNGMMIRGGFGSLSKLTEDGSSDGAVPWASITARGLFPNAQLVDLEAVDHEQYFGSPIANGRLTDDASALKTARATFTALGLAQDRCTCPGLEILQPAEGAQLERAGKAMEVGAEVTWPTALDDKPWLRVQSALAWIAGEGIADRSSLGVLKVNADHVLAGSFSTTDIAAGKYLLVVQAQLIDGTRLESAPRNVTIVTPTPTLITPAASATWVLESYTPFSEPGYWGNDCYSNFKVVIGNGSFSSSYSWKDDGCGVGPPYYSGSVEVFCTWTSLPSPLIPGTTLTLSAKCTSTAQQSGGGRNSGGGGQMYMTLNPPANNLGGRYGSSVKFLPTVNAIGWSGDFPVSDSKVGNVMIPQGKSGDVLVIVASWNGPGGPGWVVYKYVRK